MKLFGNLFSAKPGTIYKAIEEGNLEEIKVYLERTKNPDADFEPDNILNYAIDNCRGNYDETITFLINDCKDVNNHKSKFQDTPLHKLCKRTTPHLNLIKLLLDKGADVNERNISGKTPLIYCNYSFSGELAELLVQHGADINAKDRYGNTVLHDDYAHRKVGNFEEFLVALLKLGYDINARNNAGYTPWGFSNNEKYEDIIKKYGGTN